MKILKYVFLSALVVCVCTGYAQTPVNNYPYATSGTFEGSGTADWYTPFRNVNPDPAVDYRMKTAAITRSSTKAKEGSYSLKVVMGFPSGFVIPYFDEVANSGKYPEGISLWLYVPGGYGSENPTLPLDTGFDFSVEANHGSSCGHDGYPSTFKYNTWIQINPILSASQIILTFGLNVSGATSLTFYIDKIETAAPKPLLLNGEVNGQTVSLNPTGGVQIFPGNPFEYPYNLYEYTWTNEGTGEIVKTTSNTRSGLTNGTIYNVLGNQRSTNVNHLGCSVYGSQKFIIGRAPTPTVQSVTVVQGNEAVLQASGATPSIHGYRWFSSASSSDNTLIDTDLSTTAIDSDPQLKRTYNTTGLHSFWAEIYYTTVTGTASERVLGTISVLPLTHGKPSASDDQIVCQGNGVTLTATGLSSSDFDYFWYNSSNQFIVRGSSLPLTSDDLPPGDHMYHVQVEYVGGLGAEGQVADSAPEYVNVSVVATPTPDISPANTTVYKTKPVVFTAANDQVSYTYTYKLYESEVSFVTQTTTDQVFSYTFSPLIIGEHNVIVTTSTPQGCTSESQFTIQTRDFKALCTSALPKDQSGGDIVLDKATGQIVFNPVLSCGENIPVGCIGGKVYEMPVANVVSASATSFSDHWNYDFMTTISAGNLVPSAQVGKWRPSATYSFRRNQIANDMNFNSGKFSLARFNWQLPESNERVGWVKTNQVTRYTQDGDPVEEVNPLDIYSTAKLGYNNSVPYLVARNADYNQVLFESFESIYASLFEDRVPNASKRYVGTAHSGNCSYNLSSAFETRYFKMDNAIRTRGLMVKVWVKGTSLDGNLKLELRNSSSSLITNKIFAKLTTLGEWSLWQVRIEPNSFSLTNNSSFKISIKRATSSPDLTLVDDVRIQPIDAEMTCYVYDPKTYRLLTLFDDQHFGLFYQYNAEGKLIRKMIETERGVKTVQETQYNAPTVDKNSLTQ
jgi:hypothetical protein